MRLDNTINLNVGEKNDHKQSQADESRRSVVVQQRKKTGDFITATRYWREGKEKAIIQTEHRDMKRKRTEKGRKRKIRN